MAKTKYELRNELREEFEAWATKNHWSIGRHFANSEHYAHSYAQCGWLAWQAALEAKEQNHG